MKVYECCACKRAKDGTIEMVNPQATTEHVLAEDLVRPVKLEAGKSHEPKAGDVVIIQTLGSPMLKVVLHIGDFTGRRVPPNPIVGLANFFRSSSERSWEELTKN